MILQDLEVGDIFQMGQEEYYIKVKPKNGFNAILLTGKEVDYRYFDNNTIVSKF